MTWLDSITDSVDIWENSWEIVEDREPGALQSMGFAAHAVRLTKSRTRLEHNNKYAIFQMSL